MIIAGDLIDVYLTAALGFSAMFAAGLGNTISDAAGIFVGRFVDQKIPAPVDTQKESKGFILCAETLGIVIGCLLGLTPLLWL